MGLYLGYVTSMHPLRSRVLKMCPVCVSGQMENRALVSKTFTKAALQSKDVSRARCEELLLFLMDHHLHLFKVPSLHFQLTLGTEVSQQNQQVGCSYLNRN